MATEYQIKILENKLAMFKPDARGKYSSEYYALFNKIKNLKRQMTKQVKYKNWNDFLAQ